MVKLVEFRIVMPLSVAEYGTGIAYSTARVAEELIRKNPGDRMEVLANEPFEDGKRSGVFAHKVFHVSARIPEWVKAMIPSLRAATLEEKSWNTYPVCESKYRCGLLGDRFSMSVHSVHLDGDRGETDNAFKLSAQDLKLREIVYIDLGKVSASDGVPAPASHAPKASKRGPLSEDWQSRCEPVMCVYKLVRLEIRIWPVQSQCESLMLNGQVRNGFVTLNHRVYHWMDQFLSMDADQLAEFQAASRDRIKRFLAGEAESERGDRARADASSGEDKAEIQSKMKSTDSKSDTLEPDKIQDAERKQNAERTGEGDADILMLKSPVGDDDDADTPVCELLPKWNVMSLPFPLPTVAFPKLQLPSFFFGSGDAKGGSEAAVVDDSKQPNTSTSSTTTPVKLLSEPPPVWVPDESANECAHCSSAFGLLLWRHHCRRCGGVFCDACSSKTVELPQFKEYYGPGVHRVCNSCANAQNSLIQRKREQVQLHQDPERRRLREKIQQQAKQYAERLKEEKKAARAKTRKEARARPGPASMTRQAQEMRSRADAEEEQNRVAIILATLLVVLVAWWVVRKLYRLVVPLDVATRP